MVGSPAWHAGSIFFPAPEGEVGTLRIHLRVWCASNERAESGLRTDDGVPFASFFPLIGGAAFANAAALTIAYRKLKPPKSASINEDYTPDRSGLWFGCEDEHGDTLPYMVSPVTGGWYVAKAEAYRGQRRPRSAQGIDASIGDALDIASLIANFNELEPWSGS